MTTEPQESDDPKAGEAASDAVAAERDAYLDQLQRTMAEFQNYRNRMNREKADIRRFATSDAVRALLPALDNLERAVSAAGDDESPLLAGVRMTVEQIHRALGELGVTPILTHEAKFDPSIMEAVARIDDSGRDENSVIDVFEKGYKLDDLIIRPARVTVAGPRTE